MDAKKDILEPYTTCDEDKPYFVDPENREDIGYRPDQTIETYLSSIGHQ